METEAGERMQSHKLHTRWALFCDRMAPKAGESNYQEALQKVAEAETVEEFMTWFLHTKAPSDLENGVTLHLFRVTEPELKPMWEMMPNGGTWVLRVPQENSKKESNTARVNEMWDSIVLGLIGEDMEEPYIVGASCSSRDHEYIITLWYSGLSETEQEPPERTKKVAIKMFHSCFGSNADFRYVKNKDRKTGTGKTKRQKNQEKKEEKKEDKAEDKNQEKKE